MNEYQKFLNRTSIKELENEINDRKLYDYPKSIRKPSIHDDITLADFTYDELLEALSEKLYEHSMNDLLAFKVDFYMLLEILKTDNNEITSANIHATDGDELNKYGDNYILCLKLNNNKEKVFILPELYAEAIYICKENIPNLTVTYPNKNVEQNITSCFVNENENEREI